MDPRLQKIVDNKVYVYEDKRVKIEFNYRNELEYIYELIEEKTKEVG